MKMTRNEKGQISLDFLFAVTLILGVSALLGALTFALTITEVVQYISFAGARSYFAADLTNSDQEQAGENKAESLIHSMPMLGSGWVKIETRRAGDYASYRDKIGAEDVHNQFVGYQVQVSFPILGLKLPFLGGAIEPQGGGDFRTRISSFLMREPSFAECQRYFGQIYKTLHAKTPYSTAKNPEAFVPIMDNGC